MVCFSSVNSNAGEMSTRFSERNSQLAEATCALDPGKPHFLDEQRVRPLLELTDTTLVESQFTVAGHFFLQTEIHRGQTDPCCHPTVLLWTSHHPARCAPTHHHRHLCCKGKDIPRRLKITSYFSRVRHRGWYVSDSKGCTTKKKKKVPLFHVTQKARQSTPVQPAVLSGIILFVSPL